jgi:hypothetical protein
VFTSVLIEATTQAEGVIMSLVYIQGWEVRPGTDSLARWNVSGTVEPYQTAVTFQHPDGYGGGDTALAVASGGYVEAPSVLSGLSGGGQLQSCIHADSTWTAGGTLLALIDSNGDDIGELRAADSSDNTRIAVLHAGTTIDTTSIRLATEEWHRLTLRYQSGTLMTLSTYVDGTLVSTASATRVTTDEAVGIRWGGASGTTLYHDHSTAWTGTDESALRATWVQGLRPNGDNATGSFTPSTPGSLYPMLEFANDGNNCETTTDPDELQVNLENRADIDSGWDPIVLGVQIQGAGRGHGTLDKASVTMELAGTSIAGTTLQISGTHGMPFAFSDVAPGGGSWLGTDLDNLLAGYKVSS